MVNSNSNYTIYQIHVIYLTCSVMLKQRGTWRQAKYRNKYPTTQQQNISMAALHPPSLANKLLTKRNRRP